MYKISQNLRSLLIFDGDAGTGSSSDFASSAKNIPSLEVVPSCLEIPMYFGVPKDSTSGASRKSAGNPNFMNISFIAKWPIRSQSPETNPFFKFIATSFALSKTKVVSKE